MNECISHLTYSTPPPHRISCVTGPESLHEKHEHFVPTPTCRVGPPHPPRIGTLAAAWQPKWLKTGFQGPPGRTPYFALAIPGSRRAGPPHPPRPTAVGRLLVGRPPRLPASPRTVSSTVDPAAGNQGCRPIPPCRARCPQGSSRPRAPPTPRARALSLGTSPRRKRRFTSTATPMPQAAGARLARCYHPS